MYIRTYVHACVCVHTYVTLFHQRCFQGQALPAPHCLQLLPPQPPALRGQCTSLYQSHPTCIQRQYRSTVTQHRTTGAQHMSTAQEVTIECAMSHLLANVVIWHKQTWSQFQNQLSQQCLLTVLCGCRRIRSALLHACVCTYTHTCTYVHTYVRTWKRVTLLRVSRCTCIAKSAFIFLGRAFRASCSSAEVRGLQ